MNSENGSKNGIAFNLFKPILRVALTLALLVLCLPFIPPFIALIIEYAATGQGYHLTYEEADIRPIDGTASYKNLLIEYNGKKLLTARDVQLYIDTEAVFDNSYIIKQLRVNQATLDFSEIPWSEGIKDIDQLPPWHIEQLSVRELTVNTLPQPAPTKVRITSLDISNLDSHSDKPGELQAKINFDNTHIHIESQLGLQPEPRFERVTARLKNIDLAQLPADYLPDNFSASGRADLDIDMHWGAHSARSKKLITKVNTLQLDNAHITRDTIDINIENSIIKGAANLQLSNKYRPEAITFKGEINLSATTRDSANTLPALSKLQLNSLIDIDADLLKKQVRINNHGSLGIIGLKHYLDESRTISGDLFWAGDNTLQSRYEAGNIQTDFRGNAVTTLNIADDSGDTPDIGLNRMKFDVSGNASLENGKLSGMVVTGNINLEQAVASNIKSNPGLQIEARQGEINTLQLKTPHNKIDISSILINQVKLSGQKPGDILPVDNLNLKNISIDTSQISIGHINIGKLVTDLKKTRNGQYTFLPSELLPVVPTDENNNENTPTIAIDKIHIGKDSYINIIDNSVEPAFKTSLAIEQAEIGNIHISESENNEAITLNTNGRLGKRGTLKLNGKLHILEDGITLATVGRLTGLSIEQYSQYAQSKIGYAVKGGYADMDIELRIANNKLNGQSKLLITGLQVEPENTEIQKEFDNAIGMSLDSALGLIEDKKGHVRLEIPISGDINNPDFVITGLTSKAIGKGIKGGLLLSLQPLGIAVLAIDAIANAGGIPLGEVDFEEGDTLLNSIASERLTLLVEKMKEKPGIKLKICPIAVETEQPPQAKLTTPKPTGEAEANPTKKTPAPSRVVDTAFITRLAQQRRDAIFQFLTEKNINKNRIMDCPIEIVSAEEGRPSALLIIPQ